MSRRRAAVVAVAALALCAAAAPAGADTGWHSEQPAGATPGVGVPAAIGPVGDVAFQAPDRGMLITEGNDGNPAGLYAYDGASWYRYATVCGGHDGRIAWAGPDEFWTISDQRAGQDTGKGSSLHQISLCHFVDGQVVASYAQPLGVATSYLPMDAAACDGPGDCWFAGARLPGTLNTGAFHLHWDGQALTAIPSLADLQPDVADPARAVAGLAVQNGQWYESVQVAAGDDVPTESNAQPYLLHAIDEDSSSPFTPLFTAAPIAYGAGVAPADVAGLRLSSDGSQLWAVAGQGADSSPAPVPLLALRLDGGVFAQVTPRDPGGVLAAGDSVGGVAAEPGTDDAWVAFAHAADATGGGATAPARLARLHADGTVDASTVLPTDADGISRKGSAGPIACPGPGQCWMATSRGWLFHLGAALPSNGDPALHRLISFRPADAGVPFVAPDTLPTDDSGADPPPPSLLDDPGDGTTVLTDQPTAVRKVRALVTRVSRRVTHVTRLALTFTLTAPAHVQLVASRRQGRSKRLVVVARTKRYTLKTGRHTLHLTLNRRRWPTSLDLRATPLAARAGA